MKLAGTLKKDEPVCINSIISSLQELSILIFFCPFLWMLTLSCKLILHWAWTQIRTFHSNLSHQIGMGGGGSWSQHPSSVWGWACTGCLKINLRNWSCRLQLVSDKTNVCLFLKVKACFELMRQTLMESINPEVPAVGMALHGWDARVWSNLEQNGSSYQLQTCTNSCFSLWNLGVEVALKGGIASTSEYESELTVKDNISHLYASKHVSSCWWWWWCLSAVRGFSLKKLLILIG